MVCCSSFSTSWKLGIRYSNFLVIFVWLILNKSWNICKDLYISVQIRRETFLKLQIRGSVFFRSTLFNQLFSFSKTEFMTIQFSNIPGISVRFCADSQGVLNWVLQVLASLSISCTWAFIDEAREC